MKMFGLKVTEDELKALIQHHSTKLYPEHGEFSPETTERIHQLMKRLHKEGPDIEGDPRSQQDDNETVNSRPDQSQLAKSAAPSPWGQKNG